MISAVPLTFLVIGLFFTVKAQNPTVSLPPGSQDSDYFYNLYKDILANVSTLTYQVNQIGTPANSQEQSALMDLKTSIDRASDLYNLAKQARTNAHLGFIAKIRLAFR